MDQNDLTINSTLYDEAGNPVAVVLDGSIYRLAVTANIEDDQKITSNPFPGAAFRVFLENGGSPNMAVDGSTTPVIFSNGPAAGKIWYLSNITIILEDTAMNFSKFGGLAALTNGVDFKVKENGGTLLTIANIKRNAGFYTFANNLILESSTTDLLVVQVNVWTSSRTSLKLNGDDSDVVQLVVNDSLVGLDEFYILIRGYEIDA